MTQTKAKLHAKALNIYNNLANLPPQNHTTKFIAEFTPLELCILWHNYCVYTEDENGKMIPPAYYDDEIYDALADLGYFDYV